MESTPKEARLFLALKAFKKCKKFSLWAAAKIYNVPYITLRDQHVSRPVQRDFIIKSRKLTELEEEELVKYILNLNSRAFLPRPSGVADMANYLLAKHNVGKNWVINFVKYCPDLWTCFTWNYNYQRA